MKAAAANPLTAMRSTGMLRLKARLSMRLNRFSQIITFQNQSVRFVPDYPQ